MAGPASPSPPPGVSPDPEAPTYSKYSAAGVVLKVSLGSGLEAGARASEQRGLFQVWLQWVQGSSVVKEEKR